MASKTRSVSAKSKWNEVDVASTTLTSPTFAVSVGAVVVVEVDTVESVSSFFVFESAATEPAEVGKVAAAGPLTALCPVLALCFLGGAVNGALSESKSAWCFGEAHGPRRGADADMAAMAALSFPFRFRFGVKCESRSFRRASLSSSNRRRSASCRALNFSASPASSCRHCSFSVLPP